MTAADEQNGCDKQERRRNPSQQKHPRQSCNDESLKGSGCSGSIRGQIRRGADFAGGARKVATSCTVKILKKREAHIILEDILASLTVLLGRTAGANVKLRIPRIVDAG